MKITQALKIVNYVSLPSVNEVDIPACEAHPRNSAAVNPASTKLTSLRTKRNPALAKPITLRQRQLAPPRAKHIPAPPLPRVNEVDIPARASATPHRRSRSPRVNEVDIPARAAQPRIGGADPPASTKLTTWECLLS
jgi:hypothetical protein